MKPNRVIRVPSLTAFVKEAPPVPLGEAVVRIAASESFLPQRGKVIVPRKQVGVSLQGTTPNGEIVWLNESHIITWAGHEPAFDSDRCIFDGMFTLKEIVAAHLTSLGYDVREGDFALPSSLQPLNARFECARWVKVGECEYRVEAALPVEAGAS
jgi:hypothetical protein